MVEVYDVKAGSAADKNGILRGDYIISVNGHDIQDVIDYRYYITESRITLCVHRGPELFDVTIEKDKYDDIGLEFSTYLMDEKKSCRNKCIFCFIDQLPRGMREPLYFKDDDARLSFLMGNYITLTNLSERDVCRIIQMKLSPINISVHTMNPELRCMMMNNRHAGDALGIIKRFAAAGIKMNGQIVLCKGVNDGAELDFSMRELEKLYPSVQSVSIVPAGVSAHRDKLYPLEPYGKEDSEAVIKQVEAFSSGCLERHGSRIFFCSDEWFIKGKVPMPKESYYEGYPQLENGVGMIRSMKAEFDLEYKHLGQYDLAGARNISIATGAAAYGFIKKLTELLKKRCHNLNCNVYKIKNDFFGENITVAGLVTGRDLCRQLRGKPLGDVLYLPSVMLRSQGDVFLDDMTPTELEESLSVKIKFIDNDGAEFIRALLESPSKAHKR